MSQLSPLYSIHDIARLTGLEHSKIRFLEQLFRDFFDFRGVSFASRQYTEQQLTLFLQIDELMNRQHMPSYLVRAELERFVAERKRVIEVVAVTSGKGGVGKTTVAVNLAIGAARMGRRTILFDADLGLANVHVLAGVNPRATILDVITGRATMEQVLTDGPDGIQVVCGGSGVAELANLDADLTAFLGREMKRLAAQFDTIVIDTAAGIAQNVLHFLGLADKIVLVATPNVASVLDAYGVIKVTREMGARGEMQLLINQVDNVSQAVTVFNNITVCSQRFLKYCPTYLGYILKDPNVEQSYQTRTPLVVSHPASPNARLFGEAAAKLFKAAEAPGDEAERDRKLASLFFGSMVSPGVFG